MKLSIVLLLLVSAKALAQTGAIAGRVMDADSDCVVTGVSLRLLHAQRGLAIPTYYGTYSLDSLAVGPDTIRIVAPAYHPMICPILIKPDTFTLVDFTLVAVKPDHNDLEGWDLPISKPPPKDYERTHSRTAYFPRTNEIDGNQYTMAIKEEALPHYKIQKLESPESGRGAITGKIREAGTGYPVPFANVTISYNLRAADGVIHIGCCQGAMTDSAGIYAKNDMLPGHYAAGAYKRGFLVNPYKQITMMRDSIFTIDFELARDSTKK